MKFIIFIAMWMTTWIPSTKAGTTTCAHVAPYGLPQVTLSHSTLICRQGLALQHDNQARIPVWVSYVLTRDHTLQCMPRLERFEADPQLPVTHRAEPKHYRRSGYDQGHMAPAADQSWHPQVLRESFYLSNVAPQLPSLNRGSWKDLEHLIRSWAHARGSLTIYVGAIYHPGTSRSIGAHQVVVPDQFFKVVIDNHTREIISFLFANQESTGQSMHHHISNIQEIQSRSGIQLPVPEAHKETFRLWSTHARIYSQARRRACGD